MLFCSRRGFQDILEGSPSSLLLPFHQCKPANKNPLAPSFSVRVKERLKDPLPQSLHSKQVAYTADPTKLLFSTCLWSVGGMQGAWGAGELDTVPVPGVHRGKRV